MKRFLPIVILLGCAAAFVLGLVDLFELRFQSGDVYPPYSTLRVDPLGAMALYESLEKIPGLAVRRDFSDSDRLPEEPQSVDLVLGARYDDYDSDLFPAEAYQEIRNFLARGGRLVITFFPETAPDYYSFEDETNTDGTQKHEKMTPPKKKEDDSTDEEDSWVSLPDKWNFHTGFLKLEPDGDHYAPAQVFRQADLSLPDTLNWHSALIFTNLDSAWRVIYSRGAGAVMIERKFGQGSVVMATDSYFASNEAMAKDRHADLLAWMIGARKNVIFDEAHLGIVETSGVATLMRKYRLQGLVAGLLLLAGLFIWKNSSALVPPLEEETRGNIVTGKDSASGFVNLLRRGISPGNVLAACFGEWKKSAQKGRISAARAREAEAIFTQEQFNARPVATYRKIAETLGTSNQKL